MITDKLICLHSKSCLGGRVFTVGENIPDGFFFDSKLKNPYTDKQVDIEDEIAAEKDKQAVLELDTLKMQYQVKFGKKPHHRSGIDNLKKALEDAGEHDNQGSTEEVTGNTGG